MQRTMKLYRLPEVGECTYSDCYMHHQTHSLGLSSALTCFLPEFNPLSLFSLLQAPKAAGLRPMTKSDVPAVHRLLRGYLNQFHLAPVMNEEEVEHWLLPQENIIDTYLVEVILMFNYSGG